MEEGATIVLGGATAALLLKELFAWLRSRNQRTEIAPQPLEVKGAPEYVSKAEFEKHVEANAHDHENLFSRLNRNDRETSEIKGMLVGIRDDISAIKGKLFKTGK